MDKHFCERMENDLEISAVLDLNLDLDLDLDAIRSPPLLCADLEIMAQVGFAYVKPETRWGDCPSQRWSYVLPKPDFL